MGGREQAVAELATRVAALRAERLERQLRASPEPPAEVQRARLRRLAGSGAVVGLVAGGGATSAPVPPPSASMAATAAGEVFQLTKPTATFLQRTRGELLALVATASSSGSWWPIYPHYGCRRPGEHPPLGELAAFLELAYEALPGHGLAALAVVQPHLFTSEIFDGIMGAGY